MTEGHDPAHWQWREAPVDGGPAVELALPAIFKLAAALGASEPRSDSSIPRAA